jgi:L-ribulose-5-phosphate 3-epimerase UlaE
VHIQGTNWIPVSSHTMVHMTPRSTRPYSVAVPSLILSPSRLVPLGQFTKEKNQSRKKINIVSKCVNFLYYSRKELVKECEYMR